MSVESGPRTAPRKALASLPPPKIFRLPFLSHTRSESISVYYGSYPLPFLFSLQVYVTYGADVHADPDLPERLLSLLRRRSNHDIADYRLDVHFLPGIQKGVRDVIEHYRGEQQARAFSAVRGGSGEKWRWVVPVDGSSSPWQSFILLLDSADWEAEGVAGLVFFDENPANDVFPEPDELAQRPVVDIETWNGRFVPGSMPPSQDGNGLSESASKKDQDTDAAFEKEAAKALQNALWTTEDPGVSREAVSEALRRRSREDTMFIRGDRGGDILYHHSTRIATPDDEQGFEWARRHPGLRTAEEQCSRLAALSDLSGELHGRWLESKEQGRMEW